MVSGSLAGRLKRLEVATDRRAGRRGKFVVVGPGYGPAVGPMPGGLRLTVPAESGGDPMAALTADQKGRIRPGDRVLVLAYVDDWKGASDPGPRAMSGVRGPVISLNWPDDGGRAP